MVPAGAPGLYGRTRSRAEGHRGACVLGGENHKGNREMIFWTDEKVDMLKKLITQKYSSGRIAQEMNISRNAVIGKAHRLSLSLLSAPKTASGRASRARPKPSAPTVLRPSKPISAPPAETLPEVPFVAPLPRKDGQLHDTVSIGDKDCKWIVEGHGKNARYCGQPITPKRSWCAYHMTKFLG